MPGPSIRTDIVDVYVFRLPKRAVPATAAPRAARPEFLQVHRATGALSGTWQPVMGHVRDGETAVEAALRELGEEAGYALGRGLRALWQLESPNTYFLASHDCMML
ncbi:MAG TPA: NUDIX domain-containing protein, partial [Candidatus Thermoplasmatota archaeon]